MRSTSAHTPRQRRFERLPKVALLLALAAVTAVGCATDAAPGATLFLQADTSPDDVRADSADSTVVGPGGDIDAPTEVVDTAAGPDAAEPADVADTDGSDDTVAPTDVGSLDVEDAPTSDDAIGPSDVSGPDDIGPEDGAAMDGAPTDSNPTDSNPTDSGPDVPPLPPFYDVAINEVQCRSPEWIELVNRDTKLADVGGWAVTDDVGAPAHAWRLPAGTVIPKGGRLLVRRQSPEKDGFTFPVHCGVDKVWLLDTLDKPMDAVPLPLVNSGASVSRLPDAVGQWQAGELTPGESNLALGDLSAALFDNLAVTDVDLTLSSAAIAKLNVEPRIWVPATITLTVGGVPYGPLIIGARLKGGWGSFTTLDNKAGFKLRFDWTDPNGRFMGLEKLTLNNMVQDASMLHEATAYRLFRALGIAAPRVGYAWVRVNGVDYGLYSNIETLEDTLLARTYSSTNHLYEGAYFNDITPDAMYFFDIDEGTTAEMADLEALATAAVADLPPDEWVASLEALVDWPQLLLDWAGEAWIGHWDGYALNINNFYLHSDDDGRFTMLPWGTDQTFLDHVNFAAARGLLTQRCLGSPVCLEGYAKSIDAVSALVATLDLPAFVTQTAAFIAPYVEADPRKPYGTADHDAIVQATLDFLASRTSDATAFTACIIGPNADADGDGVTCVTDCAPDDPTTFPGADDVCGDGLDQDCNGVADDGPTCPEFTEVARGSRKYLVGRRLRTSADARAACQAEGLDLWLPNGPGEWEWLAARAPSLTTRDHWIGLEALLPDVWTPMFGSSLDYTQWGDGEPNYPGSENCAVTWSNGFWNNVPCDYTAVTICETPCADVDVDLDGASGCGTDCDDSDKTFSPFADDLCADGLDQDCNGITDDGFACPLACTPSGVPDVWACPKGATWTHAKASCEALGGHLATVHTAERQAALAVIASDVGGSTGGVWLGYTDAAAEGIWEWVDGAQTPFVAWSGGQPDDYASDEDCAGLFPGGEWNDWSCETPLASLCEGIVPAGP